MGYITQEIEDQVRVNGHYGLRGLSRNIRPIVCSYKETQIYNHGARPSGSGTALSEVPRDGGTFGTRTDDGNDPEFDPFADWQNSPPVVYPEGCDHPSDKVWYLIGRSHGKEEQFAALMPVIEEIIERVSK